jgi:isocitrate dehydrogenase (NAD+)
VGGLGLAPGANIGYDAALFEAVHGSAPDIAGQNLANPCAMALAGAMMLDYLGEIEASNKIQRAIADVIMEGVYVTRDLNPEKHVGTIEMTDAIVKTIEKM